MPSTSREPIAVDFTSVDTREHLISLMPVQSSRARVFLLLKQTQKLDTSRVGILSALLRKP